VLLIETASLPIPWGKGRLMWIYCIERWPREWSTPLVHIIPFQNLQAYIESAPEILPSRKKQGPLSLVLGHRYHPVVLFCKILTLWLPICFHVGVIPGVRILSGRESRGTVDVDLFKNLEQNRRLARIQRLPYRPEPKVDRQPSGRPSTIPVCR